MQIFNTINQYKDLTIKNLMILSPPSFLIYFLSKLKHILGVKKVIKKISKTNIQKQVNLLPTIFNNLCLIKYWQLFF